MKTTVGPEQEYFLIPKELFDKRKDLIYEINNLVSLCNEHHRHQSIEGLEQVNRRIAEAKHITVEELLKFAEAKEN